jgi:hypothetical protein
VPAPTVSASAAPAVASAAPSVAPIVGKRGGPLPPPPPPKPSASAPVKHGTDIRSPFD